MKCNFHIPLFPVILIIAFCISLNLTAQTPYVKPAPYRNNQDYKDAHPAPKYTPDKPKSSATTTNTRTATNTTTVENEKPKVYDSPEPDWWIRATPTNEEFDQIHILEDGLVKLIQSAKTDYKGYLGIIKVAPDSSYYVINTDFLQQSTQQINIRSTSNKFYLFSQDAKMIKKMYWAMSSRRIKRKLEELENMDYKEEDFVGSFDLYSNGGDLINLKIFNDFKSMEFTIKLAKHQFYTQGIDSLKLSVNEIPEGYTLTEVNNCASSNACDFYKKVEIPWLKAKLKTKRIQNFESKKGNGCIMYFEFENIVYQHPYDDMMWPRDQKPIKDYPEDFYVKDNYLIVWSFKKSNDIIRISQEKVKTLLGR